MVSRNQLAIVIVIISFGLIGPMSFIAQESAKNTTTATDVISTPPTQPVQLSQVLEYTADVTGEIIEVHPALVVILESNATKDELYDELLNFSNATLASLDYNGYYTASFVLESPEDRNLVLSQFMLTNHSISEYAMPAEIKLPDTFTAYRGSFASELTVNPTDKVDALVSGYILSGPANFTLRITKSGNTKQIVALEAI